MICAKDIYYQYPGGESSFSLRGVSLTIEVGEYITLMGSNGSGKTTLVQCFNGLLMPDQGDVFVDGLSIRDQKEIYEIRRKIGMVFQNPDHQIVAATVEREIAFGLENLGLNSVDMKQRVAEALERFHLENYQTWPPHLLSGGERQRLALASVWVMQPQFLILDEPTSLLDPYARHEILQFLKEEKNRGEMGILLITQFSEEARMGDRLLIMDQGCVVMDDAPLVVFEQSKTLKLRTYLIFIGLQSVLRERHCPMWP